MIVIRKLTVRLPVVELDLQLENVTDVDAVGEIKLFVKGLLIINTTRV